MSLLLCLGRRTLTGLLTTSGAAFEDWSAAYRLFSCGRVPVERLFDVVRQEALRELEPGAPILVAMDDTLLRRSGTHTPGVSWRRDPLGPHFQTNFVRAQRFLQVSLVPPHSSHGEPLLPIGFYHAPTPAKPKAKADEAQWRSYQTQKRLQALTVVARERLGHLRAQLDAEGCATSTLLTSVDGGYTNATLLRHLPERVNIIGRVRKDAKLFFPPPPANGQRGRPRCYGQPAPTPEQLRADPSQPWQEISLPGPKGPWQLRYKRLQFVVWNKAAAGRLLQLIVLAPTPYRLHQGGKLLYRQPSFLICTDPELSAEAVIAAYLRRWGIEVNFRDQKTLLGVGQAQVRHPQSVEAVPALAVASYATLLLAARRAFPAIPEGQLPRPRWQNANTKAFSTQRAITQLRAEVWRRGLGLTNFTDFASAPKQETKPQKICSSLVSAVLYAST